MGSNFKIGSNKGTFGAKGKAFGTKSKSFTVVKSIMGLKKKGNK